MPNNSYYSLNKTVKHIIESNEGDSVTLEFADGSWLTIDAELVLCGPNDVAAFVHIGELNES